MHILVLRDIRSAGCIKSRTQFGRREITPPTCSSSSLERKQIRPQYCQSGLLSPEVGSEDLLHYYVVLLLLPAKSDHHHLTSCPPLRSASIKRWTSHKPAGLPNLRGPRELTARPLTECQRRTGNGRTLFAREEFDRISIVITARGSNHALIHALRRASPLGSRPRRPNFPPMTKRHSTKIAPTYLLKADLTAH